MNQDEDIVNRSHTLRRQRRVVRLAESESFQSAE